ncbi:MAG: prephenate dehydratase [Bacillota bacterium]
MSVGKLGYLGPQGTFSEEAALLYNKDGNKTVCEYSTIGGVINAVQTGEIEEGLVPLENSLEGGITITLDHLARQEGIYICHELYYPVRQCLMAEKNIAPGLIDTVLSHPHALGQCAEYLNCFLPEAECIPVESTAAAAKSIAGKFGRAAIAPRRAAELFNLTILQEGVQDNEDNKTRFVILSWEDHPPTGADKTSMVLTLADRPGSLYKVLGFFAQRNINLTRIESRPSRQMIGDWLFFIDCEGHRSESVKVELWKDIQETVPFFKLLGSYPKADRN